MKKQTDNDLLKMLITSELSSLSEVIDLIKTVKAFCKIGDLPHIQWILKNTSFQFAEFDFRDYFSFSCESGNLELVKFLLSPSVTSTSMLDSRLSRECNAGFARACYKGHFDIVQYLLESSELPYHIDLNNSNNDAFKTSVYSKQYDIILYLLTSPKLNERTKELFLYGITDLDLFKLIVNHPPLKNDIKITSYHHSLFQEAIRHRNLEFVRYLIESPELTENVSIHAEEDIIFQLLQSPVNYSQLSPINEDSDIYHYLIFEANVELTPSIIEHIKDSPDIKSMFAKRNLEEQLKIELIDKEIHYRKVKI